MQLFKAPLSQLRLQIVEKNFLKSSHLTGNVEGKCFDSIVSNFTKPIMKQGQHESSEEIEKEQTSSNDVQFYKYLRQFFLCTLKTIRSKPFKEPLTVHGSAAEVDLGTFPKLSQNTPNFFDFLSSLLSSHKQLVYGLVTLLWPEAPPPRRVASLLLQLFLMQWDKPKLRYTPLTPPSQTTKNK